MTTRSVDRRSGIGGTGACVVVLTLLVGCGEAPEPVVVHDRDGVPVVDNREPVREADEGWRLGPPLLALGGPTARGAEAFRWVVSAFIAESGELVVVESGGDLHRFNPEGRHLGDLGGQGDGPGEFRMIAGAGTIGDSIWAYDYSNRRLSYLAPDGTVFDVRTLEGTDASLLPVGRLGDGFLLASSYQAGAAEEAGRLGLRRDTVDYRLFRRDGSRGPAIGRGAAREYVVGEEDGRLTMATPPFARRGQDASADDVWVHGDQSSREFQVRSADGTLRRIVRWSGPDLGITEGAVRAEVERRVRDLEGDEVSQRRFLLQLTPPDSRPAHGAIHLAPDGVVWVETAPGMTEDDIPFEPPGWHLFDPDGRWLGTVESPGRFRLTQVLEDRVVGVRLDDLDVEHVEVRPTRR